MASGWRGRRDTGHVCVAVKKSSGRPRGRPPKLRTPVVSKAEPMTKTPKNVVLTSSNPSSDSGALVPEAENDSAVYPKVLYHKDSKPGALISQLVVDADAEKALGDEWMTLADLEIETAPAAAKEGE